MDCGEPGDVSDRQTKLDLVKWNDVYFKMLVSIIRIILAKVYCTLMPEPAGLGDTAQYGFILAALQI